MWLGRTKDEKGFFTAKCKQCKVDFKSKYSQQFYCSEHCKKEHGEDVAKEKIRQRNIDHPKFELPTSSEIYPNNGMGMYEDMTQSERTIQGKAERKKILNCSVECLLDELGDIE